MQKPHSETKHSGQYGDLFEKISVYWKVYGGWPALRSSPYFHLSLLALALTTNRWIAPGWWSDVIDVVPSMLGFTLAGFAIFLGFGDSEFLKLISGNDDEQITVSSPYIEFSSRFMHFVLVQVLALFFALIAQSFDFPPPDCISSVTKWLVPIGSMIGYWVFLYGLATGLASGVAIFDLAKTYDDYTSQVKRIEKND